MRAGTTRRLGVVVLIATICATLAPTAGAWAAPPEDEGAAGASQHGSWIVALRKSIDADAKAPGLAKDAGGRVGHVYRHALNGFVFEGSAQAAGALERNPNVRSVVPDGRIAIAADAITSGVGRISANHPTLPDAHEAGFTGAGVRIAIVDTGIDLDHSDLVDSLDLDLGLNCMTDPAGSLPPQDGHGHGTHVAGIAAAPLNGVGVIGVAPQARIVPIKVLDDTGHGEWSNFICGLDHLTGLNTDADPDNDIDVANMSLGDVGTIGSCNDGFVREAVCTAVAEGMTLVAAAGNSTVDTSTFIPAAMPEVIAVSAINDLDGKPGGLGGCLVPQLQLYCDDRLAEFSNYGLVVDVTAPGFQIYSDWKNDGYSSQSGTSMASPHVAGVAALVLAANATLTPADVEDLLKDRGECPNGAFADAAGSGDCVGKGQWGNDPDGYGEPVVNALHAAQAAATWDGRPRIMITNPAAGSTVSSVVDVTATATDDDGVVSVAFYVNGSLAATDTNAADGWSFSWDTGLLDPGVYTLRATATDTASQTRSVSASVSVDPNLKGDWVGVYGVDGYVIGAWNGSSGDLAVLPSGATYTVEQGTRTTTWPSPTTDVRALESPDQGERRAGAWYHASQVRVRLDFTAAYTGTLHLYAVDWGTTTRREDVTVDDGSGPRKASLTTSFNAGAWIHYPVTVPAGGSIVITVDNKTGSSTGVLSGLFLGRHP
jgi:subtilisin family serine protease